MSFNNDTRLRKHEPSVHKTKPELTSLTLNTNREANKQTPGNKAPFLTEPSSENQQPQPLYKTSINRSKPSKTRGPPTYFYHYKYLKFSSQTNYT